MNKQTMKKKSSDDPMPELTLRDMLTPIFRHRRIAFAAFSAVFVLAILLAWVWAARYYTSTFQVVVEQDRTDPTVTTAQSGTVSSKPVTTDQVASEVALLQGTDMLHNVVVNCGLTSGPSFLDSIFPPKDPVKSKAIREESATRRLEKKLKVEAQKTSDVIDVSYGKMGAPETPACVLQTLSKLYLDKHLQLQRPAGTSDFFAEETKKYEKALADSELQLASFANQQGGAPDLIQVNMAQAFAKTELDYQLANELIAAHKKRIANIKEQMAITPSRSTTTEVSNSSNMLLQNLQASLLAAQVKRTQLLVKYEPGYPLVREIDQEIAQTQEAINKAQDLKYVNKTMDRDPTYEFLREDLAKTNADLASATASAAALSNSLKSIKLQMANLDSQAVKQASLLREVKANEANYLLYLNKREQERSSDALDKRGIANVAISVPPTVPLLPAHSPMAVMAIGFVLALVIGVGSALLAEHFDPSFRTPDEIVESLNIPVLASVPRRAA